MKKVITSLDRQRDDFITSLYSGLKKETANALKQHKKYASMAFSYVNDGLDNDEVVELLILDGLSREAASKYVNMAEDNRVEDNDCGLNTYSFTYETSSGKLINSMEYGKVIKAGTDESAWEKAEELINNDMDLEAESIISINRIND